MSTIRCCRLAKDKKYPLFANIYTANYFKEKAKPLSYRGPVSW